MLPAPRHVNQLRAGGRFPSGASSEPYDCMVASGVMALDAWTRGGVRPSVTALRAAQSDQDRNGIGLDDLARAWAKYDARLRYGPATWSTLMGRFRAGDGAILAGNYGAVGAYSSQPSFRGPHAIYVQRETRPGVLLVNDPLANAAREWPETIVRRFYLTGFAQAGWGVGTPPSDAGGGDTRRRNPGGDLYEPGPGFDIDPVGAIGDAVGAAAGRIALLVGIVALGIMGVWLVFREPATVVVNLRRAVR